MTTLLKIAAAIVALALIVTVGREIPALLPPFTRWVASLGAWGPLAFIAGYSIAPVIFAPAFLLTIAAGAIFGFVKGVIYVMIGATIGATLAFLTGRYLARHFVEGLLTRDPRLMRIDRAVERHGFRLVALLRMSRSCSSITRWASAASGCWTSSRPASGCCRSWRCTSTQERWRATSPPWPRVLRSHAARCTTR
jgi:uncharacterized membrane protein YdjX (TVP38/TMEM64 family)